MGKVSAGVLIYRRQNTEVGVLLVHPGGPFWAKKDDHAWSIPKGLIEEGEPSLEAAKREFKEELGQKPPDGNYTELEPVKQKGGKTIVAWAVEGNLEVSEVKSNTFELEWPPRSGQTQQFPEVDKAEWFDLSTASRKAHPGQSELLRQLAGKLGVEFNDESANPENGELSSQQVSLL